MSKIHFNNTFSSGCVQFMAADWPATTAHKMIYLLTSYTVWHFGFTSIFKDTNIAMDKGMLMRFSQYEEHISSILLQVL